MLTLSSSGTYLLLWRVGLCAELWRTDHNMALMPSKCSLQENLQYSSNCAGRKRKERGRENSMGKGTGGQGGVGEEVAHCLCCP